MTATRKGPLTHRILVFIFSAGFGVLFYWLLGFVINDIGTWPGPNYSAIEEQMLDRRLADTANELKVRGDDKVRGIEQLKNRQTLLKDSIDNSTRTMSQLLEIQRLSLEKESDLSPAEQAAMAENIQLFLANQKQYQTLNEEMSKLNTELNEVHRKERAHSKLLEQARVPIRKEYHRQSERHNLRLAGLKLAVLIPLLVVALVLYVKKRSGTYGPLIYAFAIAVAAKVMLVLHDHFPARYFKYLLILVALVIVTLILIYLLRMIAFPKRDWLLKQYREAYESFLCPICTYPIRRGPLRYMAWTRRSIRKVSLRASSADASDDEAPYTCPMCATSLFEKCGTCSAIRHSLLPACEKCGATAEAENAE